MFAGHLGNSAAPPSTPATGREQTSFAKAIQTPAQPPLPIPAIWEPVSPGFAVAACLNRHQDRAYKALSRLSRFCSMPVLIVLSAIRYIHYVLMVVSRLRHVH